MEIISRNDAMAADNVRYFTGKPCPHGHLCERFVSTWGCVVCTDAHKKRYRADPRFHEHELAYKRRYREENHDAILAYAARYWRDNPNAKEVCKRTKAKNAHKVKGYNARYWEANSDRLKERYRIWCSENPEAVRHNAAQRRARVAGADGRYGPSDIALIYEEQGGICPGCLAGPLADFHVDHVTPLILGGSNWPDNLQILCPACNSRKRAMHPLDWYKTLDRNTR